MLKKVLMATTLLSLGLLAGCGKQADIVSENLSQAADNFEVFRRIVFYNGIADTYMLEVRGFCALGNNDPPKQRTITCKVGPKAYKKHFLGLSDNVTYFAEQIDGVDVSNYQYQVIFRPSVILPNISVDVGQGTNLAK